MEVEQQIAQQLEGGEQLLWSGQPGSGIRFRRADFYMVPFSLLWGGFAVYWEILAFRHESPLFFRFWGVPFVLFGVHLVVGRFILDSWQRANTLYGVTNRRVIIVNGIRTRRTTSLPMPTIPAITLAEREDGSGDVVFDTTDARHVAVGGLVPRGSFVPIMLEFLPNVRHVYNIIREAQQSAG